MAFQFGSIEALHESFEKKEVSVEEVTRDYLVRAQKDSLNAFITICEERAIEQAVSCDRVLAKNGGKIPVEHMPLFGVPIGLKDVLTVEGVKTTCASKILANYIPPYTATSVGRLENAGAVTVGKLNMDEFAMGGSNENSAYGPVIHPTHSDRVPGGSSGGSAASVVANYCLASLGTDTGGSVRLPASFCGLVGVKPTYGRISRYGLIAFASSLDQVGTFSHTVMDSALLLDAMSGLDPMDSTSAPLEQTTFSRSLKESKGIQGLRIGVPKEFFGEGVDDSVKESVQESIRWFEKNGAKLVPISLPHTKYSVAVYYILAVSEASSNLSRFDGVRFGVRPEGAMDASNLTDFYKTARSLFGAEVKRRIILGTFSLSSGYYDAHYKRACQVRRLIKRDYDQAFKEVDIIAGPVSTSTAYKLGAQRTDPLRMYLNDIFTIPSNLAGLPALSIPCGKDQDALPIGLHLIANQFNEEILLGAAQYFEKNRGGA
jgi:aspartyl-tRNA(Asn)/glutamyl-tRNA(Gln) amidotransferase subunit A